MTMNLVTRLTVLQLLFSCVVYGQDEGKIQSDRGGKAQTPWVTPAKTFQVEAGLEWEKQDQYQEKYRHPELVLKYGLFNKLELRARVTSATEKFSQYNLKQAGLEPLEIGIKAAITQGKGVIPHTALTAQVGIPKLAAKDFKADKLFPILRLSMENDITKNFDLEYNVAAEWDGYESNPSWHFAFSPHLELSHHWQVFVETFGKFEKQAHGEVSIDAGVLKWFGNNVMIDLTTGFGVTKDAPKNFIDGGVSFRLH